MAVCFAPAEKYLLYTKTTDIRTEDDATAVPTVIYTGT